MEKHYKFNSGEWNNDGFNLKNGTFFTDFVKHCERDFYDYFLPFHANYLFANENVMILLKKCFQIDHDSDYGMDLIDGKIDLDTNLEIETYSERTTVYGIGSEYDEDEPLYLIKDEEKSDGLFLLKYIPDTEDDDLDHIVPITDDIFCISKINLS